jgi:hypothetical protein
MEVVKAYAHTTSIITADVDFWKQTIEIKKGAQVARMKAARIHKPQHVMGNKI